MLKIITIAAAFLAGIGAAAGIWLLWPHLPVGKDHAPPPPAMVQRVRIELQKYVDAEVEGSRLNVPKRPSLFNLDTPDYFLELQLRGDAVIRTITHVDTPVGNGIEWQLSEPIRLEDIYEVRLYDAGVVRNALVDRVTVNRKRYEEGQLFNFHLLADLPAAATPSAPPTGNDAAPVPVESAP